MPEPRSNVSVALPAELVDLPILRTSRARLVGWAFGAAGLTSVLLALRSSVTEAQEVLPPSWWSVALAVPLVALSHVCGARAWARCLPHLDPRQLSRAYYGSQLGKYIPGGIWQPVGQVALVPSNRPLDRRATIAGYLTSQVCFVGTGATLAGLGTLLVLTDPPVWITGLALLALASVALLDRRVLTRLLAALPRGLARALGAELVPSQDLILRCAALSAAKVVVQGTSFALVLSSIDPSVHVLDALIAYTAAWTVGVVAVPVPSGIGVREAVLVVMLGASGPALAPVLAASVVHRVVTALVELAQAGASAAGRAPAVRPEAQP